jgi:outer membrane receptor protein involved in Fe transport
MIDSYTNFNVVALGNTGVRFLGNESLNLPTMNMIDLGYRANISEKVLVDFEFFRTNMSDISAFEPVNFETDPPGTTILNFAYLNNDLKVRQTGASFMVNWAPVRALKFRFFGTVQHTELEDYDKKIIPEIIDPFTGTFKLPTYERQNTDHTRTPSFYGGATANWRPLDRLSVFAHVYYMGEQTYRHEVASYNEEIGSTTIDPRTIFNLKIGYEVINGVNLFVNGRNIFNSEQDEFGFTDQIGGLYLAGLNFNF